MTPCACGHGCARNTGCRTDGPAHELPFRNMETRDVPRWTFTTFHAPACRVALEDPGARCVCRDWSPKEES